LVKAISRDWKVFCTEKEQEDVDRIQKAFSRNPQESTSRASLQLGISQTTVWTVVHPTDNKPSSVTLSYFVSSFILLFPV
jgi:hypothetical protein